MGHWRFAHGQILKAVTGLPVHQPAKRPVDVDHLPDAENAVEIAPRCYRIEHRRADHFRRYNAGQTADEQRHQRDANPKVRRGPLPPGAGTQPRREAEQAGRGNADRIFQVGVEKAGRDERHKHAAYGAAGRDGQVKLRQVPRRGPGSGQFPMAEHAEHEQSQRIGRQVQPEPHLHQAEHHESAGAGAQNAARNRENGALVPALAFKAQHEREQVNGQRHNPEERDHRDLLTHLVRRRHEQGRPAGGQQRPEENGQRGRRSRVLLGRCRFGHGCVLRQTELPRAPAARGREGHIHPAPDERLRVQAKHRLDDERVAQQRKERSDVRQRIEPVR